MKTTIKFFSLLLSFVVLAACQQARKPKLTEITCQVIPVDTSWNALVDPEMKQAVDFYKIQLDSVMNRVIGHAPQSLYKGKPQSLLSNFTADILVQAGRELGRKPVQFALMNNGGLRAGINEGPVTVGNIFQVFPFENELVLLQLKGSDVKELFKRLAAIGGEGLAGTELRVRNNEVEQLLLDSKPVEDDQLYWMATIDYLADGNSGMGVLTKATERVNVGVRLRDVMLRYVEDLTKSGKPVSAQLDNRILINP